MKASQFFISTLKEAPADAEVASHRLMLRAGFIKRLSAGIYTYMPMGLRVLRKVEAIVREEMNAAGAIELLMPVVQPAELWQESGRFAKYGPELMRVKDRHDRDFVIQPTSEEVITDIARQELRSYRALPKNFYHIQTKFRDERRPRFGVMRGREFTMKDAYSFDRDLDAARLSYDRMYDAYGRIFTRMGLTFRAGRRRQRLDRRHPLARVPGDRRHRRRRDRLRAGVRLRRQHRDGRGAGPGRAARRGGRAAAEDADAGQERPARTSPPSSACRCERTVKSLVLATETRAEPACRGEDDALAAAGARRSFAQRGQDRQAPRPARRLALRDRRRDPRRLRLRARLPRADRPGAAGGAPIRVIADRTVAAMSDFVCGANDADLHFTGANWGRDLPEPDLVADIRNVVEGDPSPDGKGTLAIQRGIEVGHVFLLGDYYSRSMQATFLDEKRPAAAAADGLLRHRHHPHRRRRHRTEPRRARHDLAGADRPVRGGDLPDRLRPLAGGARGRRRAPSPAARGAASTPSSTTAASAPARCSPTGS